MPIRRLPDRPSVEHLRNQARALQRGEGADLVREFHPRPPEAPPEVLKRADALLVVARSYGFASWPKLRATLEVIERFTRSPHQESDSEFLVLACLTYSRDDPRRWSSARAMLAARPELGSQSVFAAAAVGDVAAARRLLDRDPGLASRQGGPHRWEPLLYLAYSRIGSTAAIDTARLLLERGADPNAGFLWDGLPSPFTVLTGVFGGGEGGQPPHPEAQALAEVLLAAGADANDSQTLYNRGLQNGDDSYLRLLLRHGLGRGDGGVWHRRLGPTHPTPAQLLQDELIKAARHNAVERVGLLLRHGADPDGVGTAHPVFEGLNARQLSTMYGHADLPQSDDPVLRFLGECMRGGPAGDPALAETAIRRRPHHLVAAASDGRTAAVRLMADLGFPLKGTDALHEAAHNGHLETVRALIELGADPDRREPRFHATPRGWAEHNGKRDVAEYLATVERSR